VDLDRFDQLVRDHLPQTLRLAVRLCGNVTQAEDVVQDAMLRAARGWRGFRGESSFRTWIFRLTINAWHDQLRRRPPPDTLECDPDDHRIAGPLADASARELGEIVVHSVSTLPRSRRNRKSQSTPALSRHDCPAHTSDG
jgi:RNA polymerase sigma-70 factor (ECF subfamily)